MFARLTRLDNEDGSLGTDPWYWLAALSVAIEGPPLERWVVSESEALLFEHDPSPSLGSHHVTARGPGGNLVRWTLADDDLERVRTRAAGLERASA